MEQTLEQMILELRKRVEVLEGCHSLKPLTEAPEPVKVWPYEGAECWIHYIDNRLTQARIVGSSYWCNLANVQALSDRGLAFETEVELLEAERVLKLRVILNREANKLSRHQSCFESHNAVVETANGCIVLTPEFAFEDREDSEIFSSRFATELSSIYIYHTEAKK